MQDDGGLRVIGAGFGRTGTTSLKAALERLGFGPCYHMQTAMVRPGHAAFWRRAKRERVQFRRFFRGYRAAIDWPACEFYRELMAEFPDARVILTTRPAGPWYDSVRDTLWKIDQALPRWFPPSIRRMHEEVIWQARFGGRFVLFPRLNDRRSFARIVTALHVTRWVARILALALLVAMVLSAR